MESTQPPEDSWVAIACRDDADWGRLAGTVGENWTFDAELSFLGGRVRRRSELDTHLAAWTSRRTRHETQDLLRRAGVPVAQVASPEDRIEHDLATASWGLWPWVVHSEMGTVRVDGLPVHLSETDWVIARGAPCLGEHNDRVYGDLLGLSREEIDELRASGVI
jgi:benzylsuccinate CoA-transferase BbsF subunit